MKQVATFYFRQISIGLPEAVLSDKATISLLFRRLLRNYVLAVGLLLVSLSSPGQNINRQMVNQYLKQLAGSPNDTNRINALIELGKFHVLKYGEVKPDLDSAQRVSESGKGIKYQTQFDLPNVTRPRRCWWLLTWN